MLKNKNTIHETNALIYKNANTYRIHTDNLRWTLLAGYAAFITGLFSFAESKDLSLKTIDPKISFLLFFVSFCYLIILAVQNWFYNLYARYADDCESKLVEGTNLQTLQNFAFAHGEEINPFHPAFFFALIIVGLISYYFLYLTVANWFIPIISEYIHNLVNQYTIIFNLASFGIYSSLLHHFFLNWDTFVYKPIIKRFSNIYNPVKKKE